MHLAIALGVQLVCRRSKPRDAVRLRMRRNEFRNWLWENRK